jgi:uncharacterized membrane protein
MDDSNNRFAVLFACWCNITSPHPSSQQNNTAYYEQLAILLLCHLLDAVLLVEQHEILFLHAFVYLATIRVCVWTATNSKH